MEISSKEIKKKNFETIYPLLKYLFKPARYIGLEPNSIYKNENYLYKFCICYPDLYEIGMSNISIKILYFLLNSFNNIKCERVFLPDDDLLKILEENSIPLFSLESWEYIKNFNILGFTIHTELSYTNILKILQLSKIELFSENRKNDSPLILAGGSDIINPYPLSKFIDLFIFGESEEILPIFIKKDIELIKNNLNREERIFELSKIDGVFNPKLNKIVKKQIIKDLNTSFYPDRDFIPLVKPIQDRPSVEVSRGCLNGCRFCQAGYFYRPYREKNIETILNQIKEIIKNTGYEEINLTSLSITDYTNIRLLLKILEELAKYNISVSVPSLRLISFSEDFLNSLKIVRKAGLTFAIEAGSDEIRNKINKDFDEDKLFKILETISKNGWNLVKFYFIIGFPNIENEEIFIYDLLLKISKSFPKLKISANISLFIPKGKTPFENFDQLEIEKYINKCKFLKEKFKKIKNIYIKYSDPNKSYFEYYFSQANEESYKLLIEAVQNNKYREGWDEHFDKDFWINLFSKYKLEKANLFNIDIGIDNNFLKNEKEKFYKGEKTISCKNNNCSNCGICNNENKNIISEKINYNSFNYNVNNFNDLFKNKYLKTSNEKIFKYLFVFNKTKLSKFIGHLDFYTLTYRLLKKAGINFIYSKGFNPMPKIFFPIPSPIGIDSIGDVFIIQTNNYIVNKTQFLIYLNSILPDGFYIKEIFEINKSEEKNIKLNIAYLVYYNYLNDILSSNFLKGFENNNINLFENNKINKDKLKILLKDYFQKNEYNKEYNIFFIEENFDNKFLKNNFIKSDENLLSIIELKDKINLKDSIKNPFKYFDDKVKYLINISRVIEIEF